MVKIVEKFLWLYFFIEWKKVVVKCLNFVLSELKKIYYFREFIIVELVFEICEDMVDEVEVWFRVELEFIFG